ncbi:hypothetical protein [Candidatus Palauibacter sp.]|uniref:hypothetical protein n=1 Tax=Candidatus Palauibacter sp. TaxID=3101350 RepID=UPI003AF2B870
MTIILIAAGFFALGLTMVFLFRSAVNRDDELDRRWAEVMGQRAEREKSPSADGSAARPASHGTGDDAAPGEDPG